MYSQASKFLLKTSILLMISTSALAESALRVYCEASDEGAKIYVNGKYKADCPSDVFLPAGSIKLRVVKKVDSEYEKVFEKEFNLAVNSAKKVEVSLSAPRLSAAAIKERKLKKEKEEKEVAAAAMSKARQGDITAMKAVAGYYEHGTGLQQSSKNARYWHKMAEKAEDRALAALTLQRAKSGNVLAMKDMAQFYASGKGVKQDKKQAKVWQDKADTISAKNALESANSGDSDAMNQISRYYAEGRGVEKNVAESEMWAKKAQVTAEEEGRRIQQARVNAEAQSEFDQIDLLLYTKGTWGMADDIERDTPDPSARSTSYTAIPSMTLFGLAMDLSSAPTKSTKMATLKTRMSSRPSTFGKPDSMIAKVYNQQNSAVN